MYIKTEKHTVEYTRTSKLGHNHTYSRTKKVNVFRCDNCDELFVRDQKKIDPKRLSNNYFHVCGNCDAKRFAQKKGVEQKQIWNLSASSTLPVGKY